MTLRLDGMPHGILEEDGFAPANPDLPSGLASQLRHSIPATAVLGEKPGGAVNPGLHMGPGIRELFFCQELVLSKGVVSLLPSKSIKTFLLGIS